MSLIKVEITEDHLKVAKQMIFHNMENVIFAADEEGSPFGGENIFEDIDLILEGAPVNGVDPFIDPEPLSEEKIEYYQELYKDLPHVIEVILQLETFEVGFYKRRFHIRRGGWKKYTPKVKA